VKRPSFQFYPADWRNNANLRRCTWEARGVWVEVMGLLHDSDTYGVLRWPLKEIAQALGAPLKLVQELATKDVMKGCNSGECAPFIYTPRSGRKDGEPVLLVPSQAGPIWYSSRMVRDEYVRSIRGDSSRFETPPKTTIGATSKQTPKPRQSDGSTSTSTTTSNTHTSHTTGTQPGGVCVDNSNPSGTPAGRICKALEQAGMPSVSPQHPELLALIERGVTQETFVQAATMAVNKGKDFAYMLGIVKRQLESAATIASLPAAVPHGTSDPESRSAIEAEGERKGLGRWDEAAFQVGQGESFPAYKARVRGNADQSVDSSVMAMLEGAVKTSGAAA
jgi:hypothetical protein